MVIANHKVRFTDFTPGNITALSFSHRSSLKNKLTPSDLRLAIGKSNGNIEIWNPRNNWTQEFLIQGGKDRSIEGLCWCNLPNEPMRLFSIGGSTVITEWDLTTGLPLVNYDCNAGVIWSIAINESQDKLAVGCDNGTVVIIDIKGGNGVLEHDTILTRHESRILSLTWNKDNYIIGGCSDARIRVWNVTMNSLERGKLLHTMKVDKSKIESTLVWSVMYLPSKNQIVSGDSTGSLKIWDFQYATLLQSFKPHDADILCLTTNASNNTIFSGSVDRKIYQFTYNSNSKKWVINSNRLLHGNDIRSMTSYQSKGADFLISGGLEKTFVITSLSAFAQGTYRKMPLVTPYNKNIIINQERRLVVMWDNNNLIKIWYIGTENNNLEGNYKLICKMVLKDEDNITSCAMSPDGSVLLVGRNYSTKLFYLQPNDDNSKLQVTKLDNELLLKTGTKFAKFINNNKVIICTPEDTIFALDLESEDDESMNNIFDSIEIDNSKSITKLPYLKNINHLDADETNIITSYGCGIVSKINIAENKCSTLINLMNNITSIKINTEKQTVIVITSENKIYELNINKPEIDVDMEDAKTDPADTPTLYTTWSKNNIDNLPKAFLQLKDKCNDIIIEPSKSNMVWFWGSSWLSRFNLDEDLPINHRKKPSKKHTRDGLTITDASNFMNDEDDDEDDEDEDDKNEDDVEDLKLINQRLLTQDKKSKSPIANSSFYLTENSKNAQFYVDFIAPNELITVEFNSQLQQKQKKFVQPKLVF